jgi:hypothetical protein
MVFSVLLVLPLSPELLLPPSPLLLLLPLLLLAVSSVLPLLPPLPQLVTPLAVEHMVPSDRHAPVPAAHVSPDGSAIESRLLHAPMSDGRLLLQNGSSPCQFPPG